MRRFKTMLTLASAVGIWLGTVERGDAQNPPCTGAAGTGQVPPAGGTYFVGGGGSLYWTITTTINLICASGTSSDCFLCTGTYVNSGPCSVGPWTPVSSMTQLLKTPPATCGSNTITSIVDTVGPLLSGTYYQVNLWGAAYDGVACPPATLPKPYGTIVIAGLRVPNC